MRVVFVGEFPVEPGQSIGGVQAVSQALAAELAKQPDIELHAIAYQLGIPDGKVVARDGYDLLCISADPKGGLTTKGRNDRRRLLRKFKEISPDIIHANQTGIHALAAFDSGLPTVLTVHGIFSWLSKTLYGGGVKGYGRQILFNRLHSECLRRAKHVVLISPYVWEAVGYLGKATTYRIDNPVDEVYFNQTPSMEDNRLLFVGLISPRKGVEYLLQAFELVLTAHPGIRLDIVGRVVDQAYFQELQDCVERKQMYDEVCWLSPMDRDSLARKYASATMLILPSIEETAPCVISEAMAVGCPVVASRVGGIPYMIEDSRTGLLIEPKDPQGLAKAILDLLSNKELRRSISREARKIAVERFAPWSVAAKTVDVYHQVIEAETFAARKVRA